MCIFREKDNKCLYGIGGRHDKGKNGRELRHRNHDGLYLLTTSLAIKNPWTILENEKPIISNDTLSNYKKPASYDYQLSCIYSTILNKYVLAVRCNIRRGARYFSILFSDDCKKWSPFNKPLLDPPYDDTSNDQYYSVLLHEYKPKNILLGICLFFNEKKRIPFMVLSYWFPMMLLIGKIKVFYSNYQSVECQEMVIHAPRFNVVVLIPTIKAISLSFFINTSVEINCRIFIKHINSIPSSNSSSANRGPL